MMVTERHIPSTNSNYMQLVKKYIDIFNVRYQAFTGHIYNPEYVHHSEGNDMHCMFLARFDINRGSNVFIIKMILCYIYKRSNRSIYFMVESRIIFRFICCLTSCSTARVILRRVVYMWRKPSHTAL